MPGEEDIVGEDVFGDTARTLATTAKRELLLELCFTLDSCLGNTMFDVGPEELVTYRSFGVTPLAEATFPSFAQLVYNVVPRDKMHCVLNVRTDRQAALRSQHFVMIVDLLLDIPKLQRRKRTNSI